MKGCCGRMRQCREIERSSRSGSFPGPVHGVGNVHSGDAEIGQLETHGVGGWDARGHRYDGPARDGDHQPRRRLSTSRGPLNRPITDFFRDALGKLWRGGRVAIEASSLADY